MKHAIRTKIPTHHKVTFRCAVCGLQEEDKQIYRYVSHGWDFFIDNLEPTLRDWHCPHHPNGTVGIWAEEIPA
jgi:hypothetical protein